MQNSHAPGYISRVPHGLQALAYLLLATVIGRFCLQPATAATQNLEGRIENMAALANRSATVTIPEGPFLMGTARTNEGPFSLDLQYDDTEQPQRRIWLDQFEIDRDEVSLGEYLLWLKQQQRRLPEAVRKLIDHVMTVHALLFPWGQKPPTPALAMFGQYHVHEIPIVASVESGEEGRSPYGLHHMAGNAAEWIQDWFGIDYYATMPDCNPRDRPAAGTRWCEEDPGRVHRLCCEARPEADQRRISAPRPSGFAARGPRDREGCL